MSNGKKSKKEGMGFMGSMFLPMFKMIPENQIRGAIDVLSKALIDYKNQFPLIEENNEEAIVIILFEEDNHLFASVAAHDHDNKIIRQIQSVLVSDLLSKMLKDSANA